MKHILSILIFALATGSFLIAGDMKSELAIGRSMIFDRNFNKALTHFEGLLAKEPNNLEAILGKIDALQGMGKTTEAGAFMQNKGASTADSLAAQAYLKMWQRDIPGAKSGADQALQQDPDHYMALYLKGYIAFREKKLDEAESLLKRSISANPNYSESYYLMGDIYRAKNDLTNLLKNWNKYLEMIPKQGSRFEYVNSMVQKLGS